MRKFIGSIFVLMILFLVSGCGANQKIGFDLEKIKESSKIKELFPSATVMTRDDLVNIYDLDLTNMEEYLIVMPKVSDQADMYMVIKPVEGKVNEVKNELSNFTEKYIEQFNLYQPDEASKINDRLISVKGDYLFFIVAEQPSDILKEFMEFKQVN